MSDDAIREAVIAALAENCIGEPGSDMHSWRCAYPDRYGPCDCLAETVTDVIAAVRPLIEADLRQRLTTAIEDSRRPAPTTGTGLGWNQAIRHAARITADTTGDRS